MDVMMLFLWVNQHRRLVPLPGQLAIIELHMDVTTNAVLYSQNF